MDIDERIAALTQTVELLAHMHQDLEKQWDRRFGKMVDIVERLDRVIQIHEVRHNGHDSRLDDLEGRR
jgi:hypothetical protein